MNARSARSDMAGNARARIVASALALVALLALGAYLYSAHGRVSYNPDDPAYNRAYWTQEVKAKGASAAYAEFKQRTAQLSLGRQHFAAHVIGAVIGEALGANGVKVCDSSFGFGCYHGLFSQVISTGGASLVRNLDAACVSAYGPLGTGCQHGIGHGILEYVGYSHVGDALALCKETTQLVPLLGCTSGVFMEYFYPLTGPATALAPSTRALDPAHPYAPCTDVPVENRSSCYYELGSWLRTSQGNAEAAGKWCAGLSGADRTDCYLGVGTLAFQVNGNDMNAARMECAALAPADELSCRAGVRWGAFANPSTKAHAAEACGYTDSAKETACEKLGDLTQGHDAT